MATTKDYIEYVCEQISGIGDIRYKKMFGEYMVYMNDLPVITVCDNISYIKQLDNISELMKDASKGFPYNGAKEHYILDIDNQEFSKLVVKEIEKVTKVPRKK